VRSIARPRSLLGLGALVASVSFAQPAVAPLTTSHPTANHPDAAPRVAGDISVMSYNVKGLPWPVALDRADALRRIGERLARMRAAGRHPTVVVLQEAFVGEAKAIGDIAGYAYRVEGPYSRDDATMPRSRSRTRTWYLGETQGSVVDSGLVLLSDLPVSVVRRAPFPSGDCAGYDCLAAKGVLVATLDLPRGGQVAIATTHLNARGASGASSGVSDAAYERETRFLAGFLARERAKGVPMILAGDFNRGQWAMRAADLATAVNAINGGVVPVEGLRARMQAEPNGIGARSDALWVRKRARDMQFAIDGARARVVPVGAAIPFGTEPDGTRLSDHLGFTIAYRLMPHG